MRYVLDTNVVLSGLLWGGTPGKLLQAARQHKIELFTSKPLLNELLRILHKRKFERKIAESFLPIDELVAGYADLCTIVLPRPTPFIAPDPDDDVVIGTALAAKVDWMISGDAHLLRVASYGDIFIVAPSVAVEHLGKFS